MATGTSSTWYVRGWGQEVAQQTSGDYVWYLPDWLGSVRGLVEGSGLESTYNYDPLGTPEGVAPADYGFAGEPQDGSLGLVQLRARWYGTTAGAFLSRDPLAARAMDQFSVDGYLYGNDDPVNRTDPLGCDEFHGRRDRARLLFDT